MAKGFSLIELLIVVAIIGLITGTALPLYADALHSSHRAALETDARALYDAFMRYNFDHGVFPSTSTPVDRLFDPTTLAPLTTGDYFGRADAMTVKLDDGQVTAYDSPNIGGFDTQFWAVLTMFYDPNIVLLVAHTDQYPNHVGTWYDGVYLINGSSIVTLYED